MTLLGKRVVPIQYDQCPYKKRRHRDRHAQVKMIRRDTGKAPCDSGGRYWNNVPTRQGTPRFVTATDAKRKSWN